MIDKKNSKYDTIVTVSPSEKDYEIDLNVVAEGEEVECPADSSMKLEKKHDCVIIKKLSRLNPF